MRPNDRGSTDLEAALRTARQELDGIGSLRARIDDRIASRAIRPAKPVLAWLAMGAAALIGLAVFVSSRRAGIRPVGPVAHPAPIGLAPDPIFSLRVGDVDLCAHLAAVVDRRAVLVVWSSRGRNASVSAARGTPGTREGRYRRYPLPPGKTPDGHDAICCVYVADEGVRPALEPPMIVAGAGTAAVAFSVSPERASAAELSARLRAAGLEPTLGDSAAEICRRAVNEENGRGNHPERGAP
jgi:hypothetical protein